MFSDFNEDEFICCDDLDQILDNLTGGTLMQPEKDKLIEHVLYLFRSKRLFCYSSFDRF